MGLNSLRLNYDDGPLWGKDVNDLKKLLKLEVGPKYAENNEKLFADCEKVIWVSFDCILKEGAQVGPFKMKSVHKAQIIDDDDASNLPNWVGERAKSVPNIVVGISKTGQSFYWRVHKYNWQPK